MSVDPTQPTAVGRRSSVVISGGLRTDYVITLDGQARLREMGGNVIFAAAGAHLWEKQVGMLARVGDNFPAEWLAELRARGIDTRGVVNVGGRQDHRTFYAYIDADTRDDTDPARHFARIGVPLPDELRDYVHSTPGQDNPDDYEPLAVRPEDLRAAFEPMHPPRALHIAPLSIRTQRELPGAARAAGIAQISIDPGERCMYPRLMPHIEAMLAGCDVFMPSDMEVRSLLGDALANDPIACARWFAERGPRVVVIKLGSAGSLVYQRDCARATRIPALPGARVVDVTGAGDTFCGAFSAAYANGGDAIDAALRGTVAASFAIEDYGAGAILNATPAEAQTRLARLHHAFAQTLG
jgi:sugar/nucleoside kinase (ribokinase family)